MPEDSPSIYTIMAERVANAILGKINALIGNHNTNEQAHQDIREDIPGASSTVPNADTTTGSYGSGTSYARSNHTHPKSSLYAEASHNHTKSNITDFPTIPSKTSQLTNDSGFLTSHQSLSNYYNKSETNNYDVDFILGTQTASTSAWTGTTDVISSLRKGTTIFYKLPYASTNTSVTLNLTLKGGRTTGAKNVFYKNTTRVTTHYGVGQVVGLTYDGTAWYVISPSDNNSNNDNNYGGIQFKAGEALTIQTICCAKDNGQYYKVANGVVLDIRYPLIMTSNAVASGNITNAMYRTWSGVNIANTKSMTLTNGSQLFLEGTAYSNGKFTISSNVVTHTLTNGRYYIKVGTALSTTQIRFISDMTVYYYNGTTLKPAIKKEQIVDFPTIVTSWSNTPSDTNVASEKLVKTELEEIRNEIDSIAGSTFFNYLDCVNTNFTYFTTQYLFDYLTDIDDYYAQSLPNDTMGCGSTDSMSVTENDELLISDYQTRVFRNNTFTSSNHYVLELDLKKPNGVYKGADFEVMIGEPSKYIKFNSGYYGEFIQYLLEENGTQQEVSYKTTSDRFTDYFTLRITRNGNAWKGEWIVNDTILRTLEATTPLDISNKLGFCSYSWYNYNSDELYVKNIKITY